jgi:hypothetical protein
MVGHPRAITDICTACGEHCPIGMKQNKCNHTKINLLGGQMVISVETFKKPVQEVWARGDRHEKTSRLKWP